MSQANICLVLYSDPGVERGWSLEMDFNIISGKETRLKWRAQDQTRPFHILSGLHRAPGRMGPSTQVRGEAFCKREQLTE